MPPKVSKKNEAKKKEKTIEDKTFGLKNKKGGKAQKFIAQVEKTVKAGGNQETRKLELQREKEKAKKLADQKEAEELKSLFKPIATQKVLDGVDPKSVFCAFFKQGLCKKGDRCKFSHDPDCERKAAKRNIYAAEDDENEDDNMNDWDDDKLAEVVAKKHSGENVTTTDIVCKFFLDAVENNKYGWFWECPDKKLGCKYKHALPKGFVLKRDKKKMDKDREEISIEDLIEKERGTLDTATLTKVTLQTFVAWKKKKLKEKADAEKQNKVTKKNALKDGKTTGLSGRDLFMFNPSIVGAAVDDDDEEGEEFDLKREPQEDDGVKVHEIKFDEYGIMDDGVDDSTETQLARARGEEPPAAAGAAAATIIDEDLFDDEDLDDLEEDLDKLDI